MKLSLLWGCTAVVGGAVWLASAPPKMETHDYRKWRKVNKTPHRVESWMARLCRNVTPEEVREEKAKENPHTDKFVTVYVNSLGERAMFDPLVKQFPVGTVIVKEKLSTVKSTKPELLTVMVKRAKGFNKGNGDWEYMVLDGVGSKIQARGKLAKCQSCHAAWKSTDFVSRSYLDFPKR